MRRAGRGSTDLRLERAARSPQRMRNAAPIRARVRPSAFGHPHGCAGFASGSASDRTRPPAGTAQSQGRKAPMMRTFNILAIATLIGSATAAYSVKYETILVAEKLKKRQTELRREKDAIACFRPNGRSSIARRACRGLRRRSRACSSSRRGRSCARRMCRSAGPRSIRSTACSPARWMRRHRKHRRSQRHPSLRQRQ